MTIMADLDELTVVAQRKVPDAALPLVERAVLSAARELCSRCRFWLLPTESAFHGERAVAVETMADAEVVEIKSALFENRPLEPRSSDWLDHWYPNWAFDNYDGQPGYITQLEPNTYTLYPRKSGLVQMMLVLQPAFTAISVPKFLVDTYAETIATGATGFLLTEPKSDNPQMGMAAKQWFEDELLTLASNAARGQQRARRRTKGSWF